MKQNLALFDFDGTISKKDSMIEFLKFYSGKYKFYNAFFLHTHWLALMFLGVVEKENVKEKIWTKLFNNVIIKDFEEKARFFSLQILPQMLYTEAKKTILEHKEKGDRTIVVSASAEEWLKPWCDLYKLELISTQLEKKNGKLTGKIAGKNCKGAEKVNRINAYLDLKDYKTIFAYGDSSGDKEMLGIADYPFYRKFKL